MNAWMHGCFDVCMWMSRSMYGCMDVFMYGWMYLSMGLWMYGCMDGWIDGQMDRWMWLGTHVTGKWVSERVK